MADNPRYVKEDYTLNNDQERVQSYWFSLPGRDRQDFDPTLASVFYERERVDGRDWFTDNSSIGLCLRGHTFSFAWGRQS